MHNLFAIGRRYFSQTATKQKSYYQILELPVTASQSDIKKNYLRLAKIYHPDVYKGNDKRRFENIQEAYKCLKNVTERRKYDQNNKFNVGAQNSQQQTGSGTSTINPNNFSYEQEPTETKKQYDLEEQYNNFFNKKGRTKFQEIQLQMAMDHQFKNMTKQQRLRRAFSDLYHNSNLKDVTKNQVTPEFQKIIDDQINQKNQWHEDILHQQERVNFKNSEFGIKLQKIKYMLLYAIISLLIFPTIFQLAKQYKQYSQKTEEEDKILKFIHQEAANAHARSRFIY